MHGSAPANSYRRSSPSRAIAPNALDDDNLTGALKSIRDQVAAELRLPNDRNPLAAWRYAQRKGGKNEYAVEVHIERVQTSARTQAGR